MSDEPKHQSVKPKTDPQREQRTAQHVQLLNNSNPKDSKRTAWAVSKMFGGGAVKDVFYDDIDPKTGKKTLKGKGGNSQPMPKQLAFQQYDDARHSMEQSGWREIGNSGQGWYGAKDGNRTTWSKGGANVSLQVGREPGHRNAMSETGQFVNQFTVHAPRPKKKRGLFGQIEVETFCYYI